MGAWFARVVVVAALALSAGPAPAADDVMRLPTNGAEFSYVETGRGEPLVLIHGGLQDFRLWTELLPAFADRYRVIAYSRRNRFRYPLSAEGAPDGAGDCTQRTLPRSSDHWVWDACTSSAIPPAP